MIVRAHEVSHHNPPPGLGDPHHFLGHVEKLRRKHRAKNADDEIKAIVGKLVKIGRVAFLKPDVRQPKVASAFIASGHEIAGDIDAQHVRAELCFGNGRRSVAAAQIQDLHPRGYAKDRVAKRNVAEVQQVVNGYFNAHDAMEPVSRSELRQRLRAKTVTVLDVRPTEEFALGHVPGAINIPTAELKRRLKELLRGKEIVAYCRGPYCVFAFEAIAALRICGDWYGDYDSKKEPNVGTHKLFSFLTTEANDLVRRVHAKAMPVILLGEREQREWLAAPADQIEMIQACVLPAGALEILPDHEAAEYVGGYLK